MNRVQRLLDGALYIDEEILPVQLRIGLAVNLHEKHSPLVTLARAEASLAQVKQGNALEIDAMIGEEDDAREDTAFEQHFSEALYDNAFDLHFQPKVDLRTGRVCSAEALLRWHLPGHGAVSPERVVQLAEASGQTYELTRWVVNRALRAMREWRDTVVLPVAVNIPAGLVNSPDLANMLSGALSIWGVEPSMLTLEVTEGAVIEHWWALSSTLLICLILLWWPREWKTIRPCSICATWVAIWCRGICTPGRCQSASCWPGCSSAMDGP